MKVLYDHQVFTWQNFGGISRYHFELAKRLGASAELSLRYSDNEYIQSDPVFAQKLERKPRALNKNKVIRIFLSKKKRSVIPGARQNQKLTLSKLSSGGFDLFHPTYYDPYFLDSLKGRPFVLTVHDMIHELFPEFFHFSDEVAGNKRRLIEKAAHIIAVSDTTKSDLMATYRLDESRISVVHHGCSWASEGGEVNVATPKKFLLMVGSRPSYKNCYFALRALSNLIKETPDLSVVFAGGGSFSKGESQYFASLGLAERVSHYPASDEVLRTLYKRAEAFIFPSIYEGFGIPLLEAFSCGCPVLASTTAALKEVAGEAACYFDPKSPQQIETATKTVLETPALREKLRQSGRLRLQQFSVERCVDQTLEVYRKVAG